MDSGQPAVLHGTAQRSRARRPASPASRTLRRRIAIIALAATLAAALAACSSAGGSSSGTGKDRQLTVVLAWYPTAEYGGLYAALQQHYFSRSGLNIRVIPGGPNVNSTSIVAAGRAQVGFAGDNSAVMTAAESVPLVEIGTEFQIDPEGVEFHPAHPITSFSQLSGKTLYVTPGDPAYEWLAKTYHLRNLKVGPFNYTLFTHNPASFEFGYVTDDLPTLAASGVKAGYLLPSHFGYNDNGDVLFVSRKYLSGNKAVLQRFTLALQRGWSYYRDHYTKVDPAIYKVDKSIPLTVENSIAKAELPFIFAAPATTHGLLYISPQHFKKDYLTLRKLGVVTKNLQVASLVEPLSSAAVRG